MRRRGGVLFTGAADANARAVRANSVLAAAKPPRFGQSLMPVSFFVRVLLWLWFFGALAVGHFGGLQNLPPFGVPGIVLSLSVGLLLAYFLIPALRAWIDSVDLRALVLLHVTRFVGIYFLVLYQRGDLPRAFAVPGGMGDIIVATMALPVALAPLADDHRRRAIVIWNVVGFIDILSVILTVIRINLSQPGDLAALTRLPLSLLPTFLVPMIIATHVIIFQRTTQRRPTS